jgi:hypothetical protein
MLTPGSQILATQTGKYFGEIVSVNDDVISVETDGGLVGIPREFYDKDTDLIRLPKSRGTGGKFVIRFGYLLAPKQEANN